jgi:hypothetical protein
VVKLIFDNLVDDLLWKRQVSRASFVDKLSRRVMTMTDAKAQRLLWLKANLVSGDFGCKLLRMKTQVKGLILAQNERWRRGLGMRVVREL